MLFYSMIFKIFELVFLKYGVYIINMKSKIIISGQPGAGSTTISLILSFLLKYKYIYTGMVQRDLAKALGYDSEGEAFVRYTKEKESKYDKDVDKLVRAEFLKNENIILDSKIHGFFDYSGVDVLKVYVICSKEKRNQRIVAQGRKDGLELLDQREKANRDGWLAIYGFDILDEKQIREKYDLVIDSTRQNISQTLKEIVDKLDANIPETDLVNISEVYWAKGKTFFREELAKQNLLLDTKPIVNELLKL